MRLAAVSAALLRLKRQGPRRRHRRQRKPRAMEVPPTAAALPVAGADFALRASILAELPAVCARAGDHRSARGALEADAQPRLPAAPACRACLRWSLEPVYPDLE